MNKLNFILGSGYQFVVLAAIVAFNSMNFLAHGTFNEILLGALIGAMVTLPFKQEKESETKE